MSVSIDYSRINNTMGKMAKYLSEHNSICVSVSGGSDSNIIVHIIATYFREHLPKIHFVFVDTGIEYRATREHLKQMEEKYNITIERLKGTPIPLVVRKYGVPFLSKQVSDYIDRLQRHEFDFADSDFSVAYKKYPKCKAALRWFTNTFGDQKSRFNISWNKGLREFLIKESLHLPKISAECCHYSKKLPLEKYQKRIKADLIITGERKSEGGARAGRHSDCYEERKTANRYMPLFFWNDETKEYYKNSEGIKYSACYEKYGMRRTGCTGCPFAQNLDEELRTMKKYEPNLYKACNKIFAASYKLRTMFYKFREKFMKRKERK